MSALEKNLLEQASRLYHGDCDLGVIFVNGNEAINTFLGDIEKHSYRYVLACLMDRQISAERAWGIPLKVVKYFEVSSFEELSELDLVQVQEVFSGLNLHRFNNKMAMVFFEGVQRIKNTYNGEASKIWKGEPSSAEVVRKFLEFKGAGVKIATMAANILHRKFGVQFSNYSSIDVSPDVMVKRVMSRLGIVEPNPTPEILVYKAREINPDFPGVLDFALWEIGREFCKKTNPLCDSCTFNSFCRKQILS